MTRTNANVDWSVCPPIIGAKMWYWDFDTSQVLTIDTDQEAQWRKWPRTGILIIVLFHYDAAKPDADYRTFEYGYDYFRVPGLPANIADWEGYWIDDVTWAATVAEARADTWRPTP